MTCLGCDTRCLIFLWSRYDAIYGKMADVKAGTQFLNVCIDIALLENLASLLGMKKLQILMHLRRIGAILLLSIGSWNLTVSLDLWIFNLSSL